MTGSSNKINLISATFLVCANMIGTGVFTSLGFQLALPFGGFEILCLWVLGGILAFCGTLSYGQLGLRHLRAGGEYHYLSRIYGRPLGFLCGLASIVAGFSAPIAAAAIALASYLAPFFLDKNSDQSLLTIFISSFVVIVLTLIHHAPVKKAVAFQNLFVSLKLILITSLILSCFFFSPNHGVSFLPSAQTPQLLMSSGFAISLVFVMYAYSGWNAAVYIADEIEDPFKNLPRAMFYGTFIVMILYALLNAAFLRAVPREAMVNHEEVAFIAADWVFGSTGGKLVAGMISIGLISTISSMTWAGARVSQVMGEDYVSLRWLSRTNANGRASAAMILQMCLALIMIFTFSFKSVIYIAGFALSFFSLLAVLGIFVEKRRLKEEWISSLPTLGYPWAPLIYAAGMIWILIYLTYQEPGIAMGTVGFLGIGLLVYYVTERTQPPLDFLPSAEKKAPVSG